MDLQIGAGMDNRTAAIAAATQRRIIRFPGQQA
jgi:hypothetical protein